MSTSPSVFPFVHFALTAGAGCSARTFQGASAGRLPAGRGGCWHLGPGVAVSGQYRGDSTPTPSQRSRPNDMLCPLVTYLFVGWYAAFRRPADAIRFEQARVVLALVSFVVNVVTI